MELNFYTLCVLYLVYSFLGWAAETVVATIKGRAFVNRGVASGPFCFVYGTAAVLMAVGFADLRSTPVALFLGCAANATVVEWVTAKLLERMHRRRWWDYSDKKVQSGRLRLPAVLGALGSAGHGKRAVGQRPAAAALRYPSGLAAAYRRLGGDDAGRPRPAGRSAGRQPVRRQPSEAGTAQPRAGKALGQAAPAAHRPCGKAYPAGLPDHRPARADCSEEKALSFGDLVWLFVIGAFLGDVVETLFCRVTAGVWMSRSSLVWGPFSVVWGLALVMAAVLLRGSEERSDRSIFLFGFVMGGAYEYICSAVGELLFGVIFWDYSGFKFNLGGRVNLLYCFFWGIAAVVWIRYGYPLVAKLMANLKKHILPWMTVVLTVFMAVNMGLSALALARYDARTSGIAPANRLDVFLDEHFDNARMERVYPNAKKTGLTRQP